MFPNPLPAAHRQMHKEFNRVDLMRGKQRTEEAAIDLFPSPPQTKVRPGVLTESSEASYWFLDHLAEHSKLVKPGLNFQ